MLCLLSALLCGAEPAARQDDAPPIGVVSFPVSSNVAKDLDNAIKIRTLTAKNIEVSNKFSVINIDTLDTFMRQRDISPVKLYRPEEMEKFPPDFAQFLVTGFVSIENKGYRVKINMLDLTEQEFLFGEEELIDGTNETALWDGVKTLIGRFLEKAEKAIFFYDSEPEKEYRVGDTGPAGGIIFYAKGNRSGGWRYLEVAPPQTESRAPWGLEFSDGFITPSFLDTKSELGTGKKNTKDIAEQSALWENKTAIAAQLCNALDYGGQTDWFLPSQDELMLVYVNIAASGLGGFRNEPYWTSTESSYQFAYFQSFREGRQFFNGYKTMPMYVRAIRAF